MLNINTDTIERSNIAKVIKNTNGRFFGISFVKKDGSLREMVARTKVHKGLVGGKNTTAHISKYITCYDVKNGFRNINTETVISITIQGTKYEIHNDN